MVEVDLIARGLVLAAAIISIAYVFAKTVEKAGFTKAVLAVSVLIDFYLVILWILGIDRQLFTIYFSRLGTGITITALSIFIPVKLIFTVYMFIRLRQIQQALG